MAKKSYAINAAILLGLSAALLLFIFVLVAHHRDISNLIKQDRSALLASGSSVAERIRPVGQVSVPSAEIKGEPAKIAVAAPPPVRDGQQVYQLACVVCHDAGIAGAPKLADKGQWATRMAKGVDTLYASAVNGVQGSAGVMPAKGGNTALSDAEVKAAVDYMVARSK
ncbi:MAG: cytochrome c5 family protein [Prolixibacteraceae bacterium]|nr:cytochrome c5 family protein [Burkholderiales bacterium]